MRVFAQFFGNEDPFATFFQDGGMSGAQRSMFFGPGGGVHMQMNGGGMDDDPFGRHHYFMQQGQGAAGLYSIS